LPSGHPRAILAAMIRIIWSFGVSPEGEPEFVRAYGPAGDWAQLFGRADGYRGTKLLRELSGSRRYLTEDSWESAQDFDRFTAEHRIPYDELDARCQSLTIDECLIGIFEELG
jgi:antibiotic biosynthesis monooxygenase